MKNSLCAGAIGAYCRRYSLAFLYLLLPWLVSAKHIIGGEMTYKFLGVNANGQNMYEFTLIVYRDCDSGGGQLDNPASIGIYRGNAQSAVLVTNFNVSLSSSQNVSPVIPPCADASAVTNACVQRGTYVFSRNLSIAPGESYFIVYQRCCRTAQIVNITNPDAFGATYMVEITPDAQMLQNSSPTFANYPPTFICNNFPLDFDHSATDIDGDSLAYEFCTPLHGGGQGGGGNGCNTPTPNPPCGPPFTTVNFTPNYAALIPMGGSPTVAVNPITGHLSGTPVVLGQFVVGICVKEYRNGQLIGSVLRDFQFNVVDCTPTVFANVNAEDITGPQTFIVKRCGQQVVTILNTSAQTADLETWQWEFNLGNGNTYTSSAWNATILLPDFGTYSGRLYLNRNLNCQDTAFITINAFPGSDAQFSFDWDTCTLSPVQFTNTSSSGAIGGITNQYWVLGSLGDTLAETSPAVQFDVPGSYPVKLVVTDSDGCSDESTQWVDWAPQLAPEIPNLDPLKTCLPDAVAFHILDSLPLTGASVLWDFGDGTTSDQIAPVHVYGNEGIYGVSVAVTTAHDCFSSDTFPDIIRAYDRPHADFDYTPKDLSNIDNRVAFTNLSSADAASWLWRFGNQGASIQPNPVFFFQDTGIAKVSLLIFNSHGCADTAVQFLDLVPAIRLYVPNVFAPESDSGMGNDRFGVLGIIPGYQSYEITIWSRWGELIFQSDDPAEGWDGRRNGRLVPKGVYIYKIKMTGPRGEPLAWDGTVTVL